VGRVGAKEKRVTLCSGIPSQFNVQFSVLRIRTVIISSLFRSFYLSFYVTQTAVRASHQTFLTVVLYSIGLPWLVRIVS
jgi:hypothetical protein